ASVHPGTPVDRPVARRVLRSERVVPVTDGTSLGAQFPLSTVQTTADSSAEGYQLPDVVVRTPSDLAASSLAPRVTTERRAPAGLRISRSTSALTPNAVASAAGRLSNSYMSWCAGRPVGCKQ